MSDQLFQLWVLKYEGGRTWIWRHSINTKVEFFLQKFEVSSILWRSLCFVASKHIYSFEVKCCRRNLFAVQGGKRRSHLLVEGSERISKRYRMQTQKTKMLLLFSTWQHGMDEKEFTDDGSKRILVKKASSCNKNCDEARTSRWKQMREKARAVILFERRNQWGWEKAMNPCVSEEVKVDWNFGAAFVTKK